MDEELQNRMSVEVREVISNVRGGYCAWEVG